MVSLVQNLTLEAFLTLPETKPASEYINGKVFQKPMPKRRHSLLQSELCTAINAVAKPEKVAYAFPELRCTFGERSLVPDIAVLDWHQIEFDEEGIPTDDVFVAPTWVIEILSPDQSANRVTSKIVHCLRFGSKLGWLVDPKDRSILIFMQDQLPELCRDDAQLVIPKHINLTLTANEVFSWLKMM